VYTQFTNVVAIHTTQIGGLQDGHGWVKVSNFTKKISVKNATSI